MKRSRDTADRGTALRQWLRREFGLDYFEADVLVYDLLETLVTLHEPVRAATVEQTVAWDTIAEIGADLQRLAANLDDAELVQLAADLQTAERERTETALPMLAERFGQLIGKWKPAGRPVAG